MKTRILAGIVCSLAVIGCGGGGGGGGGGPGTCTPLFTSTVVYSGQEDVTGCYTYSDVPITATVTQDASTCEVTFVLEASSATHTCTAKLSGHQFPLSSSACGGYVADGGSVTFNEALSSFSGSFNYASGSCTGTTVFHDVGLAP